MKNCNWLLPLLCLAASPLHATSVGIILDRGDSEPLQHEAENASRKDADHDFGHDRHSDRETFFTESFSIERAGTYRIYLDDLEDDAPLADFSVKISTGRHHFFGHITDGNGFSFDAMPGEYDVSIRAIAGHETDLDDLDIRIVADTALVPVPATVWLLGSGLLGLIGMARRKTA